MTNNPTEHDDSRGIDLSNRTTAVIVPVVVTLGLFALAAAISGEPHNREMLPIVRFISLLMLVLGLYTAVMAGKYCAYSQSRWKLGQLAAGLIGIGAGCVWSASAFGTGFVFFMVGTLLVVILMPKEIGRDARSRRRARRREASQ